MRRARPGDTPPSSAPCPRGGYRLELAGPAVQQATSDDASGPVVASFTVQPTVPQELVELAADPALLDRLAGLSGGHVFTVEDAAAAAGALGVGS